MSDLPKNRFKKAIGEGRQQIGLWSALSSAYTTEIIAGSGFDWLCLDAEHSPNDVLNILPQLQAMADSPTSAMVRPPWNDMVLIKRYLDIGAQTLLIPYVQNADEARAAVRSTRYPPQGVRGVSVVSRATGYGRVKNYMANAASEICVIVQVETLEALDHIEDIAAIDGVDGLFIGPSDLAASMGYLGQPGHPEVKSLIEATIPRIKAAGKPAGILTGDMDFAQRCIDLGSVFTAIGVDAAILARETEKLAARFRPILGQ